MADAPDSVLAQIQKLIRLANKNTNENEAAAAMAKAQELLAKWNLDFADVATVQHGSGARERAALDGGFHNYERELWKSVAELNFCICWHERAYNRNRERDKYHEIRIWKNKIYLVGRRVNVAATRTMTDYLLHTINSLTREHTEGMNSKYSLSNWANSFRRGIVARVCRKLRVERDKTLEAEEKRRADAERAASGASTSTALSLATYIDRETDANIDFIYGDGTAAKWASERAERAARAREQAEAYTRWAAAHPEGAAAERAKAQKTRRRGGRRSTSEGNLDHSAYWSGYNVGESVSIHRQVDEPDRRRIGR